jgi:hypothetical protein
MRPIRWGLLAAVVALHLIMKAPVWDLISRIDLAGGSTGWQRSQLISAAVRNIGEWWAIGTTDTGHWGWAMFDVTNQYLLEGVRGGVLTMTLFIAMLAIAFGCGGRAWRLVSKDRPTRLLAWALGVSLFVHCTSFIAVNYFDQIYTVFYLTLAALGSLSCVGYVRAPAMTKSTRCDIFRNRVNELSAVGARNGSLSVSRFYPDRFIQRSEPTSLV